MTGRPPVVRRLAPGEAGDAHTRALAERVRVVRVPWLTTGVAAVTLGRWILVSRDHAGDRGLLAHELVHVRQWAELGVPRFLWRYVGAYLAGRRRGLRHDAAYRAIPFEEEARRLTGR